jgi:phosphatidylglycerophosphatase A
MSTPQLAVEPDRFASLATRDEPTLHFMLQHPAHLIALGFGTGLLRPGPGTGGTLGAWFAFVVLNAWLSTKVWIAVIIVALAVGAWAAERTGAALGRADHGAIVIDEIVAFWIVLLLVPASLVAQGLAFLLFRAFDIAKPPPIGAVDRRFKQGVGVMADDLIAAFYTLLVFAVGTRLWG